MYKYEACSDNPGYVQYAHSGLKRENNVYTIVWYEWLSQKRLKSTFFDVFVLLSSAGPFNFKPLRSKKNFIKHWFYLAFDTLFSDFSTLTGRPGWIWRRWCAAAAGGTSSKSSFWCKTVQFSFETNCQDNKSFFLCTAIKID